jgi:D-3-phosphoglycerate dehydrogenase
MSKKNKVLIVDKMHDSIVPLITGIGLKAEYKPGISREEILACIGEYVGLIVRSKIQIDRELIDNATQLLFVARAGAGIDNIDTSYAEQKNIHILNAPEGNRDPVGEHAVGLLLNLLNKISSANDQVKKGIWDREGNRGIELKGKVVGIFGYGNTGEAFSKKLSGFDCQILAYDKFRKGFSNSRVQEVQLDEFRRETEILSIHVPLDDVTSGLFSKEELIKYPQLKIILNTARGGILNLKDALEMLENKSLIGLGLDVLTNEKIKDLDDEEQKLFDKLILQNNVIITPHVAGWTEESYYRINQVLVEKIKDLDLAS